MAFGPDGNLALLHALVALAALQVAPFQNDPERANQRALGHYVIALQHHRNPDSLFAPRLDDAVLATSLVFAHFEVIASLIKMLIEVMERRDHEDGTAYARCKENDRPARQTSISNSNRPRLIFIFYSK